MTRVQSNTGNTVKQGALSGLRLLERIINCVRPHTGPLVQLLEEPHRHGGNPGYPAEGMFLAYFMQFILKRRYSNDFLEQLDNNIEWLNLCGLNKAPTESAYSRFKKRLLPYRDLVDKMAAIAEEIGDELESLQNVGIVPADAPRLGANIAIDSTDLEAFANPRRKTPADPDATWGRRTTKRGGKEKTEPFYGYKNHEAADAYYGLPLGGITLSANEGDGPQLPPNNSEAQGTEPLDQP